MVRITFSHTIASKHALIVGTASLSTGTRRCRLLSRLLQRKEGRIIQAGTIFFCESKIKEGGKDGELGREEGVGRRWPSRRDQRAAAVTSSPLIEREKMLHRFDNNCQGSRTLK